MTTAAQPDGIVAQYSRTAVPVLVATVSTPTGATRADRAAQDVAPSRRYLTVVSADLGPAIAAILHRLAPVLAEIICCDSVADPRTTGSDLAMRAQSEFGFGQDFVFTVPELAAAIDYAVRSLMAAPASWDGSGVLVVGPSSVAERARRHLTGRD